MGHPKSRKDFNEREADHLNALAVFIGREAGLSRYIVAPPIEAKTVRLRIGQCKGIIRVLEHLPADDLKRVSHDGSAGVACRSRPEFDIVSPGGVAPVIKYDFVAGAIAQNDRQRGERSKASSGGQSGWRTRHPAR